LSRLIERGGVFAPLHDGRCSRKRLSIRQHTLSLGLTDSWTSIRKGFTKWPIEHPVAVKRRRRLRLNSLVKQARAAL